MVLFQSPGLLTLLFLGFGAQEVAHAHAEPVAEQIGDAQYNDDTR